MKIFLVEDSDAFRAEVSSLLQRSIGAEIVGYAIDAEDAVVAIRQCVPDLVVLDLKLRTGNGLQVLEHVKRTHPAIRFIVLTNVNDPMYRTRGTTLGAESFLDKSGDMELLPGLCAGIAGHDGVPQEGRLP